MTSLFPFTLVVVVYLLIAGAVVITDPMLYASALPLWSRMCLSTLALLFLAALPLIAGAPLRDQNILYIDPDRWEAR